MTQEQIINQIVSKYLSQVEICSSVEEQIIDVELEVDGITIYYGNTLHTEGHTEYRYDTDFCETELVGYDIDNVVITDGSLVIETDGTLPDYIQSITAYDIERIIIETIKQY